MPMIWSDGADAKLFAAVIATGQVKLDYVKLAQIMGTQCTAKAVSHRITKLREIAKGLDISGSESQAATATPRKRTKKPKNAEINEDDEESPIKKRKKAAPLSKAKDSGSGDREEDEGTEIKAEASDGSDEA